jgi:hypothetical protein
VVAENLAHVFAKLSLGTDAAVVYGSRILECAGKQEEMASLNSDASDVLSKDVTKLRDDAMEATAVDHAESRFQLQVLAAKVSHFKDGCVGIAGGEAAAGLNGRGTAVQPENAKTLGSQPPANLTISAPYVDDALIFREPARVDRFNEFLLRLVGFPEGAKFGVLPLALPSVQMSSVRPIGKELFYATLQPTCQFPLVSHSYEPVAREVAASEPRIVTIRLPAL